MDKKRKNIIILVIVAFLAVTIITSTLYVLLMGHGTLDYWATYDDFDSIAKDGNNKVIFTMPGVWGYPDGNVVFTDCAFSLHINDTSLPPANIYLENHCDDLGCHYWDTYAQIAKGAGVYNSVTFVQGNVSYIVTFIDSDKNGHVTQGDLVMVECTEPLRAETNYTLDVCVDIDGTWGVGLVYGTFQN